MHSLVVPERKERKKRRANCVTMTTYSVETKIVDQKVEKMSEKLWERERKSRSAHICRHDVKQHRMQCNTKSKSFKQWARAISSTQLRHGSARHTQISIFIIVCLFSKTFCWLLLLSSLSSFLFSIFFASFQLHSDFSSSFFIVFVLLTPASIVCPSGAWMPFAAPSCRMAFDETPAIVCAKWVTIVYGLSLSLFGSAVCERGMKGIPNGPLDSDAA